MVMIKIINRCYYSVRSSSRMFMRWLTPSHFLIDYEIKQAYGDT